jgi:hypothetical protein
VSDDDTGADDERTDRDTLELAVVVLSVPLVVSTLGYVGWQATTTAETTDPTASVVAVDPVAGEDRVRVRSGSPTAARRASPVNR